MAEIRVFLLTCRRPKLLPRALASLRAQTFTDWVCELHNDAPEDDSPRRLLHDLGDSRITLHHHASNWGPIAVFNHAFTGGPEPFSAILEDDNWWDPAFLETTRAALASTPAANVVWTNMKLWQEEPEGKWSDTGRTIWKTAPNTAARLFQWPEPLQCTDALHSNGAMLYRGRVSANALVPPATPFAIIEPMRERLLPGAWLFLPDALAHFALTLSSARSRDRTEWAQAQLLVAGSYLATVPEDQTTLGALWQKLRDQRPRSTSLLFQLAMAGIRPRELLRHATLGDWARFLAGAVRHPRLLARALRFQRDHRLVWSTMVGAARQRTAENRRDPAGKISSSQLFSKILK